MKENYKNEVRYYTFPAFDEYPEIVHAFTSRECGVSSGYYSSLNMGIHTGDDLENIKTNYRIVCRTLGLNCSGKFRAREQYSERDGKRRRSRSFP